MNKIIIILMSVLFIISCTGTGKRPPVVFSEKYISFSNQTLVKSRLNQQLKAWRGVKYKLGGMSRSGIDCSGFVHLTYLSKFGIKLPRSTELQSDLGVSIKRNQLRAGDLVFFKTGLFTKHVGIYVGAGQFIHASTSRGVTQSQLNNVYWMDKYWKAKRIKT